MGTRTNSRGRVGVANRAPKNAVSTGERRRYNEVTKALPIAVQRAHDPEQMVSLADRLAKQGIRVSIVRSPRDGMFELVTNSAGVEKALKEKNR